MNINKAIKKQKKSFKRYMLLMSFIFFFLPIIAFITHTYSLFIMLYLAVIELLTILLILKRLDKESLIFRYTSKIKIYDGIFNDAYNIVCDKVSLVHTMGKGEDFKILILLNSKIRNRKLKKIEPEFLKRYKWSLKYYNILKNQDAMKLHYYIILSKGGYRKYEFLNFIYRHCVQAEFSEEAIERIKEYRQ